MEPRADPERLRANLAAIAALEAEGQLTSEQATTARKVLLERMAVRSEEEEFAGDAPTATTAFSVAEPLPPAPTGPTTGLLSWAPYGAAEVGLSILFLMVLFFTGFTTVRNLTSPTYDTDAINPSTRMPSSLPGGYAPGAFPGVPTGRLTPQQYAQFIQLPRDVPVGRVLERANLELYEREGPEGKTFGIFLMAVHPSTDITDNLLRTTTRTRRGTPVPGFARSTMWRQTEVGRGLREAIVVQGPVSIDVALFSLDREVTEADLLEVMPAAARALDQLPEVQCMSRGDCRARQYAVVQVALVPLVALGLAVDGRRRRRLRIGFPVAVPGVRGVIVRVRRPGHVLDRDDVVIYDDLFVLARAPYGGPEPIIGGLLFSFAGVYAGQRSVARRDATRRNELARRPKMAVANSHKSNVQLPLEEITAVHVVQTGRNTGRVEVRTVSGQSVRFTYAGMFNRYVDVARLLTEAFPGKVVIRTDNTRRVLFGILAVLLGLLVLGALASAFSPPG